MYHTETANMCKYKAIINKAEIIVMGVDQTLNCQIQSGGGFYLKRPIYSLPNQIFKLFTKMSFWVIKTEQVSLIAQSSLPWCYKYRSFEWFVHTIDCGPAQFNLIESIND